MTDSQDLDRAVEDLDRYEARLKYVTAQLAALQAEHHGLQSIVTGLRTLLDSQPHQGSMAANTSDHIGPAPGGASAILAVVGSEPDRDWSMDEIYAEMQRRGLDSQKSSNPKAAARASLQRLVNGGEVERTGRSLFRLSPTPASGEVSGMDPDETDNADGGEAR